MSDDDQETRSYGSPLVHGLGEGDELFESSAPRKRKLEEQRQLQAENDEQEETKDFEPMQEETKDFEPMQEETKDFEPMSTSALLAPTSPTPAYSLDDEEAKEQRLKKQKPEAHNRKTTEETTIATPETWRSRGDAFLNDLLIGHIHVFNVFTLLDAATHGNLPKELIYMLIPYVFQSIPSVDEKTLMDELPDLINVVKDGNNGYRGFVNDNKGKATSGLFALQESTNTYTPVSVRTYNFLTKQCVLHCAWQPQGLIVSQVANKAETFLHDIPIEINDITILYNNNTTTTLNDVQLDGDNRLVRGHITCETCYPQEPRKNTKLTGHFNEADAKGLREVVLEESMPYDDTILPTIYKGQGRLVAEPAQVVRVVKEGTGYEVVNDPFQQMSIMAGFWKRGVLTGLCCMVDALLRHIYILTLSQTAAKDTHFQGDLYRLPKGRLSSDTESNKNTKVECTYLSATMSSAHSFREVPSFFRPSSFKEKSLNEMIESAEDREILSILNPKLAIKDSKAFECESMKATRTAITLAKEAAEIFEF